MGFPDALEKIRARARQGNEFIHFSFRLAAAAKRARTSKKALARVLIEHPEDLGAVTFGKFKGRVPASIWQLPEMRKLVDEDPDFNTVVGHQCQFGVDYSKPTRLTSNIPGILEFGYSGWPKTGPAGEYQGPLPKCGHRHKEPTHGQKAGGGFNSSAKAAYPPGMC